MCVFWTVDGGWSEWSVWSSTCPACGSGDQTRYRSCTNPAPQYGGSNCIGQTEETEDCNILPCPSNFLGRPYVNNERSYVLLLLIFFLFLALCGAIGYLRAASADRPETFTPDWNECELRQCRSQNWGPTRDPNPILGAIGLGTISPNSLGRSPRNFAKWWKLGAAFKLGPKIGVTEFLGKQKFENWRTI